MSVTIRRLNRRAVVLFAGAAAFLVATASPGVAVPGDLDPAFGGGDGRVTTDFGDVDRADGVAVQADGKIVVAGSAGGRGGPDFAVARYNADGSLDPTFDGDGKVTTDFASSHDQGFAVALQADGKIVVAGEAFLMDLDFALARYNTDGSLDPTFGGGDGKVSTDLGLSENDAALAVAIQADGKIVAAGYVRRELFHPNYPEDFAVARFNADGSPDLDFGVGGNVTTDLESDSDVAYGVAFQADGKIVAVGSIHVPSATTDFGLARYNTDGSLDTTFDGDGKLTTHFGVSDSAAAVALQGDGKIVAAGNVLIGSNFDFGLARYNTNGSLDTTFDGDGKVTTGFADSDSANEVAIQGDGKIVAAGSASMSGDSEFALARYNTNGSLDTTFGGDGRVTTDFGGLDTARGIAIRGDRRLVAVGCTSCSDASDFAVARYKICRTTSRRSSIPC
jgi:uncharacterized delta-60 repeat protein